MIRAITKSIAQQYIIVAPIVRHAARATKYIRRIRLAELVLHRRDLSLPRIELQRLKHLPNL